jgi:arginine decarboxylase
MWKVSDSVEMYGIDRWGEGYFNIDGEGNVNVSPDPDGPSVPLIRIIRTLEGKGLNTPIILRFPQILSHRIASLHAAFSHAVDEFGYEGCHKAVFPFKVNQRKEVIEALLEGGRSFAMGLEVGTKAELLAASGLDPNPKSLLICNGFKDDKYLRLALDLGSLGKPVFVVVEEVEELRRIIEIEKETGCRGSMLGLRIKLYSKGSGRWTQSGGELAKFGLTPAEVVECLDILEAEGMKDRLAMLHFHIGSQITQIRRIQRAVKEAVRKYTRIHAMGFNVRYFNVGGGMGVDYEGSRSSGNSSANYSVQEYANDVVYSLYELCKFDGAPMPDIITESGRAIAAYHSVLVMDVAGSMPHIDPAPLKVPEDSESRILTELYDLHEEISAKNYSEYFHDAVVRRDEMLSSFGMGLIPLRELALAERLYVSICRKAYRYAVAMDDQSEEFWDLPGLMARKYIGNFSVFQSMPDAWAIKHLFPIMPITRLAEQPGEQAKIGDITCDSDGEIHRYINGDELPDVLNVHTLKGKGDYLIGVFLLGAYQDTIGDFHNLLGNPDEAFVTVSEAGEVGFGSIKPGHRVSQMLTAFNFDPEGMVDDFRDSVENAREKGLIRPEDVNRLLSDYRRVLEGRTYLDKGK